MSSVPAVSSAPQPSPKLETLEPGVPLHQDLISQSLYSANYPRLIYWGRISILWHFIYIVISADVFFLGFSKSIDVFLLKKSYSLKLNIPIYCHNDWTWNANDTAIYPCEVGAFVMEKQ